MTSSPQPKKTGTTLKIILAFLAGGVVQTSLTFFVILGIIVWQYQRFEQDMDLSVPAAETMDDKIRNVDEMIINVSSNGDIVLNSEVVSAETLRNRLKLIASELPDQAVILRGHEDTDFQTVIDVLDEIKDAGIWNVAFATTKP